MPPTKYCGPSHYASVQNVVNNILQSIGHIFAKLLAVWELGQIDNDELFKYWGQKVTVQGRGRGWSNIQENTHIGLVNAIS